jgi:outer membrane protease
MKHLTHRTATTLGLGMLLLATSATLVDGATSSPTMTNDKTIYTSSTTQADGTSPKKANNGAIFTLALGTERMAGDTTYQIGFPVTESGVQYDGYFPFSELKWPLDIWLARLEGSVVINDQWRINATLKKNLSSPGGNMEDSDWITPSNPGRLDVYSQSEISSFDALIMDVDIDWIFMKNDSVSFYAGLGYLYQKFDYDAKILHQYSPSGLPGYEYYGSGEVGITYNMIYSMPYLKLGTDFKATPDLTIAGSISYSPFAHAEDEDNHLLRENGGKIMKGDMDGHAYMLDLSIKYMFTQALFVEGGFQYMKIDVDGTQNQVWGNGDPIGNISQESKSTQTIGYVSLGFTF